MSIFGMRVLPAHPRALGIEEGNLGDGRGPAVADDLDLEAVGSVDELRRDVAERDRFLHVMRVAAGGDPADDLAFVPDRLVADAVGVLRIHHERDQPTLWASVFLLERGVAADEVVLAEMDEAA